MSAGHDTKERGRGRRTRDVPKSPSTGGRRKSGGQRAELNRELLACLHGLRRDVDQLVERWELRLGGQLNELIAALEGDPALGQKPAPFSIRTARAMLEVLEGSGVRPKKARPKDFARMEALVREIARLGEG